MSCWKKQIHCNGVQFSTEAGVDSCKDKMHEISLSLLWGGGASILLWKKQVLVFYILRNNMFAVWWLNTEQLCKNTAPLYFWLRVRTVFHETDRVCPWGSAMFTATFNLVTRVALHTVIFRTLKEGILLSSLASNICFSYRNFFKNWCRRFIKYIWRLFVKKFKIPCSSESSDNVQILLVCDTNTCTIVY